MEHTPASCLTFEIWAEVRCLPYLGDIHIQYLIPIPGLMLGAPASSLRGGSLAGFCTKLPSGAFIWQGRDILARCDRTIHLLSTCAMAP